MTAKHLASMTAAKMEFELDLQSELVTDRTTDQYWAHLKDSRTADKKDARLVAMTE